MSVVEAGQVLGVGRVAAYAAVRRGEIPSVRIGRKILVPKVALQQMLTQPATGASACPRAGGGHRDSAGSGENEDCPDRVSVTLYRRS